MNSLIPDKKIGVSCDLIIQKDDKILLGKRGSVFGRGTWAIPGGHLEPNEKVEEGARREAREEVGIIPTKIKLLTMINDLPNLNGQLAHYVRFVFLIEEFTGRVTNPEPERCEGWEWFDKNKLPEPIFVGHQKILKYYLSNKNQFFIEE